MARSPKNKKSAGVTELREEVRLRRLRAKREILIEKQNIAALSIYAAADKGRKNKDWRASPGSADLAIIPDAEILNARARQLNRDSWIAKSITKAFVRNIVGRGIATMPHAKKPDGGPMVALNHKAKSEFDHWAITKEACDVERKQTWPQKQQLAVSERATVGEHFVVWSYEPPLTASGTIDYNRPVGLRLQSFEAEQLDLRVQSFEGREVRGGIELDANGAAVAYHFYTRNPNDYLYRHGFWSVRIERARVLHYYKQERVLQTRGVTPLAPVMNDIREHSRYRDATLWRAVMEACIGLIIRKPYPSTTNPNGVVSMPFRSGDTGATQSGLRTMDMVPGMIGELMPGEDVTTLTPSTPGNGFEPFVRATLQGIGAGTGMSMGQLSRQSDGNYSAARQDMLTDRQEWEPEQELLVDDLNRPIYRLWFQFAALEGRFDGVDGFAMEDFTQDRNRFLEADFIPPPQAWIDPEKEANAFAMLLKNRLITREEIIAMRGGRFLTVVNRLAAEKDTMDEVGLTVPEDAQDRTELRDIVRTMIQSNGDTLGAEILNGTNLKDLRRATNIPAQPGYKQQELPIGSETPPAKKGSLALTVLKAPKYRVAEDRVESCETCSFNAAGFCRIFQFDIQPDHVCNAWSAHPIQAGTPPTSKGFPPGPLDGEPGIDRGFQSDAERQDVGFE